MHVGAAPKKPAAQTQAKDDVEPAVRVVMFAWHDVHEDDPETEYIPKEHVPEHCDVERPAVAPHVPAGHCVHDAFDVAPFVLLKVPAGHAVQFVHC